MPPPKVGSSATFGTRNAWFVSRVATHLRMRRRRHCRRSTQPSIRSASPRSRDAIGPTGILATRSQVLSIKDDFSAAAPLLRIAILRRVRRLPTDERNHWRRLNGVSSPLEKVLCGLAQRVPSGVLLPKQSNSPFHRVVPLGERGQHGVDPRGRLGPRRADGLNTRRPRASSGTRSDRTVRRTKTTRRTLEG
jgi:hypothetical protein